MLRSCSSYGVSLGYLEDGCLEDVSFRRTQITTGYDRCAQQEPGHMSCVMHQVLVLDGTVFIFNTT